MNNEAAILFFRRIEATERSAKKIDQKGIISYFNQRTRNLLHQTNFPVFEHLDDSRVGDSIQYRFYHAVQNIFDQGYKRVIIVGNDCPQLTKQELIQANDLLRENDLVLGPDSRGGSYLIAITQKAFTKKWALSLPWHSSYFCEIASQKIEKTTFLTALSDFNNSRELSLINRLTFRKNLLLGLIRLLSPKLSESPLSTVILESFRPLGTQLRAPPAL